MLNSIVIQGRFTGDPSMRFTQSNTAVVSVSLAVQRSRKNQNGEYQTDFIDVVFWGSTAEMVYQWFRKGDMAIVRGRLESRKWQDKNGNNRTQWEVQAEQIEFAGSKANGQNGKTSAKVETDDFAELDDEDDGDTPFQR